jgi:hypothetical protein
MSDAVRVMTDDEIFMRLEFCYARLGRLHEQIKIARWRGDSFKAASLAWETKLVAVKLAIQLT